MTFSVIIPKRIRRKIRKYPTNLQVKLVRKLDELVEFPKGLDIKKIGDITYRIRAGDFRIIIDVYFDRKVIEVVKLDVRGRIRY
jgi:mRNA interferase RelE/StbE